VGDLLISSFIMALKVDNSRFTGDGAVLPPRHLPTNASGIVGSAKQKLSHLDLLGERL
jgi:hypothetical protein